MEQEIKWFYEADTYDFANYMVGRRIVAIEAPNESGEFTITLDDGTVIVPKNNRACCAWFEVTGISSFDFEDNVITNVIEDENEDCFNLIVLSNDRKIAQINIDGDLGTGYYIHQVSLQVRKSF